MPTCGSDATRARRPETRDFFFGLRYKFYNLVIINIAPSLRYKNVNHDGALSSHQFPIFFDIGDDLSTNWQHNCILFRMQYPWAVSAHTSNRKSHCEFKTMMYTLICLSVRVCLYVCLSRHWHRHMFASYLAMRSTYSRLLEGSEQGPDIVGQMTDSIFEGMFYLCSFWVKSKHISPSVILFWLRGVPLKQTERHFAYICSVKH